jgi:hypothetical protein
MPSEKAQNRNRGTIYEVTVQFASKVFCIEAESEEEAAAVVADKVGEFEDMHVEAKGEDPDACDAHPFLWRDDCAACSQKLRDRVNEAMNNAE